MPSCGCSLAHALRCGRVLAGVLHALALVVPLALLLWRPWAPSAPEEPAKPGDISDCYMDELLSLEVALVSGHERRNLKAELVAKMNAKNPQQEEIADLEQRLAKISKLLEVNLARVNQTLVPLARDLVQGIKEDYASAKKQR